MRMGDDGANMQMRTLFICVRTRHFGSLQEIDHFSVAICYRHNLAKPEGGPRTR
jgi:hypothetical protein